MAERTDILLPYATDAVLTFTALTPTNIAGWTIALNLRYRFRGAAIISKAGAITDSTNGVFTVTLSASDLTIPKTDYVYDCERTDSGAVTQLALGVVTITPSYRLP